MVRLSTHVAEPDDQGHRHISPISTELALSQPFTPTLELRNTFISSTRGPDWSFDFSFFSSFLNFLLWLFYWKRSLLGVWFCSRPTLQLRYCPGALSTIHPAASWHCFINPPSAIISHPSSISASCFFHSLQPRHPPSSGDYTKPWCLDPGILFASRSRVPTLRRRSRHCTKYGRLDSPSPDHQHPAVCSFKRSAFHRLAPMRPP